MKNLNQKNLLVLIKSCNILSQDIIDKWVENLEQIPEGMYPLLWRTFSEIKNETDELYTKFELNRDKNGEYEKEIRAKATKAINLVKTLKLKSASDVMSL